MIQPKSLNSFTYPRKKRSVYEVLRLSRPCHRHFKYSVATYTLYKEATAKTNLL